jgi:hypothetical protein
MGCVIDRNDATPILEALERRLLLSGSVVVSEFMASNSTTILDGDNNSSDWIELYNPTDAPVNLNGWFLTDKTGNLDKWEIPNVTLAASGDPSGNDHLLIFASGQDDAVSPYWDGQYYHTNFTLAKGGENILLVRNDGSTIEHGYEDYPAQLTDVSYGTYIGTVWNTLVEPDAVISYHVPTPGDLGDVPESGVSEGWTAIGFDDSTWTNSMVIGAADIVISEISTGDPNFVEIQNVSDQAIDTTDWAVLVNNGSLGINSVNAISWQLPASIASSQVLSRSDDPADGAEYWGGDILWDLEGSGWVMVADDTGEVVDFVVWGYSAAQIALLDIGYGGFTNITVGEQWSGDGANLVGGGEPGPLENAIGFGSSWDYLHPLNASDPSGTDADFNTTWMQPTGYDGPAFANSGPGILGFGTISYGPIQTDIGTPPSGSRYTAYFRSEFVLDEPMVQVGIEILNDDGAFIYIDGVEVGRNNINVGKSDTYFVFADNHSYSDGTNVETETRTLLISDLEAGTHTIAVSVHQANTGSSDLGLDLRLFGRPVPGGEMLRRVGQTDGDTKSDFQPNDDPTRGVQNPGLVAPFGLLLDTTMGVGFSNNQQAFEDIIETDVDDVMQGVNSSLWTRVEFSVPGSLSITGAMTLNMMYDDGFVAYLNGVKIAQRNAPAALGWDSQATLAHADSQAVVYEEIDITSYMDQLLEGVNVLAIHGLNVGSADPDFLTRAKLVISGEVSTPHFFADATPGQPNTEEWRFSVEDTAFDHDRGFYTESFDLVITTDTPDAQIYYTTNGSDPLMPDGSIRIGAIEYTQPITISTTTVVRAAGVKIDHEPTNVDTQTYIFLTDIINQPANPTGFPSAWGGTTADYEMDPDIIFNSTYQGQMLDALQSIPTMSIVMDGDEMFGSNGIYTRSTSQGIGWERETSLEYFDPNSTDEFQINAGLRIYGGAFRGMNLTRKHSFRVLFKGAYGPTKLEFPLFDDEGATTSFDTIILRAGANDAWNNWGDADTQYITDQYMRDLQLALGEPGGHGTFVHLYINGLYWGLYNPVERPDVSFGSDYFGGDKEDWDSIHDGSATGESNKTTWNAMLAQVRAGAATDEAYQKIQGNWPDGTNNPAYNDMLDVDNLIAYMFSNFWGGTGDWPGHNWYAGALRPPEGTGFKFFNWDSEGAIAIWSSLTKNSTGVSNGNTPAEPYAWLRGNAEFNLLFGDYAHEWLFNGGPASYQSSYSRYQGLADEIELAIVAESARWGDQRGTLYTPVDWAAKRDYVLYTYMPARPNNVLGYLQGAGLYPNTVAPVFKIGGSNQHGGEIAPGAQLSMAGGSGTIYYTTDGTDPRATGGAIVGTPYISGSISLLQPTRVKARRYYNGQWSALNAATFYINPPAVGDLAVTELNYNPYAPTNDELLSQPALDEDFTAADFEFVELYNTTNHAVDLLDVEFRKGVEGTITFGQQTILPSGQYALLVADVSAFEARYGTGLNVMGVFDGSLDNAGEILTFGHPLVATLESLEYNDAGSWPNRADGGGSSLELIDISGDHADGSNWRSSSEYGGSPGQAGTGPRTDVLVNEVLTHSDDPLVDTIELHNTTDALIDIGGWFLSDGGGDYAKFEIPAGTEIPGGGYVVFYEGHYVGGVLEFDYAAEFGGLGEKDFAISGSHGDDVWLVEADASGNLLSFVDHVEFGAAANGESFGRWPDGAGDLYPMTLRTLEGDNSSPRVGPVIISEVMYNPPDPDGVGVGVDPDDLEFIELYNPTGSEINLASWQDNPHTSGQYFADWRLRGGVDMEFDAGTTIAAGGMLVVLSFDPNKPENAARVADFRAYYGIDPSVRLAGGYSGKLNDDGERITLQHPDSPPAEETDYVPHLIQDQAIYDDIAPWATSPDGLGDSLQRTPITAWGDDPANWIAAAPDPGSYAAINNAPTVIGSIANVVVDEDAPNSELDVSGVFDDIDVDDILTFTVSGNTNPGMVTTNFIGTDLTLSYISDRNGVAVITVQATDQLGGHVEDTFTVTVNPINDDPPFVDNPITDFTVDEDAPNTVLDLSNVFSDPDIPFDTLDFSLTDNTNDGLVTANLVGGTLTLSYLADLSGTADITVRATDNDSTWVEDTFTVTVDPGNDAPTVANPIADVVVNEDAALTVIDLSDVFDDIDPGDTLSLSATGNTNSSLVATDVNGDQLTLSYLADQNGSVEITIRATDLIGAYVRDTFTITVNPVNDDSPFVDNPIIDFTVDEDAPNTVFDLSNVFNDPDIPFDTLDFSITDNSNDGLVAMNLAGGTLTLSYLADMSGTADIIVRATDLAGEHIEDTFTVTVDPVNDDPTVANPIDDLLAIEDGDPTIIDLSDVFDDIDPGDLLLFSVTGNTNVSLVTTDVTGTNLTLSYLAGQIGATDITVRATDLTGVYVEDTFTVTVNHANAVPSVIAPIADSTVIENASDTLIDLADVFDDADIGSGDVLTLTVAGNTNPALVTTDLAGDLLTLSYAANQYGSADITVRATDLAGAWVEDAFIVTVEHISGYMQVRINLSSGAMVLANIDPPGGQPINYVGVEIRSTSGKLDPIYDPVAGTGWKSISDYKAFSEYQAIVETLGIPAINMVEFAEISTALTEVLLNAYAAFDPGEVWSVGNPIIPGSTLTPIIADGDVGDIEIVYGLAQETQSHRVTDYVFVDNFAPRLRHTIADVDVLQGADDSLIDLLRMFVDFDSSDLLTYTITGNTNLPLVSTSILGGGLTLAYGAGLSGVSDITVRATDPSGDWVEGTINVTVDSVTEVVGRNVFYGDSAWGDAVAPDKAAMLPGETTTPANYTNYARGVNGLMVDISSMTGTPSAADVAIQVNSADNPDVWTTGPTPTVDIDLGAGDGGSDRVILTWADGEIINQWVEVTVLATANTGLPADDVFYFGNSAGDADGDGDIDVDDFAALKSELGRRGDIGTLSADFNADGRVSLADFVTVRSRLGAEVQTPTTTAPAPAPMAAPAAAPAAAMVQVESNVLPETPVSSETSGVLEAYWFTEATSPGSPLANLLTESLSTDEYVSEPQAISATTQQYAATGEYDLAPLGGEPASDAATDDLLIDILAESALAIGL